MFRLEIDLRSEKKVPKSIGTAQLNDLSSEVFLVLTSGDVNKTPGSRLRRKSYLDGGRTCIMAQIIRCHTMQQLIFYIRHGSRQAANVVHEAEA